MFASPSERTLIVASIVNGVLGLAVGGLAAGIPGAQIGLLTGLLLSVLPLVTRRAWAWLVRPDGLPRFLAANIGAASVAGSLVILNLVGGLIGPVIDRTRLPVLLVRFAAIVLGQALASLLGTLWRIIATPLGMANVAALAAVAANFAGLDYSGPVAFLALGMLLLVLLVSESEARDEEASRQLGSAR